MELLKTSRLEKSNDFVSEGILRDSGLPLKCSVGAMVQMMQLIPSRSRSMSTSPIWLEWESVDTMHYDLFINDRLENIHRYILICVIQYSIAYVSNREFNIMHHETELYHKRAVRTSLSKSFSVKNAWTALALETHCIISMRRNLGKN